MPRKIRELKRDLAKAGFRLQKRRGKGSHSIWAFPNSSRTITISGNDGDDAKDYQEQDVREAIAQTTRGSTS
ncbi:MAG TPA: type II toxin-antitoxin system HicA family toxin [Thermomicrobiales bacterium]|nr:type II toxin-antitoxin system HicA family toxin [Thermomicrobiales bacterium]